MGILSLGQVVTNWDAAPGLVKDIFLGRSAPQFQRTKLKNYGDIDIIQSVRPRHSNFKINGTYNPLTKVYTDMEYKAGSNYLLMIQAKALGKNDFTVRNIIGGFEQVIPKNEKIKSSGEIPLLVIDQDAWNYAMERASQSEKIQINELYKQPEKVKGQLVLVKDLSKNAEEEEEEEEEELWNAKSKVRKKFNKEDTQADKANAKNDDTFEEN